MPVREQSFCTLNRRKGSSCHTPRGAGAGQRELSAVVFFSFSSNKNFLHVELENQKKEVEGVCGIQYNCHSETGDMVRAIVSHYRTG